MNLEFTLYNFYIYTAYKHALYVIVNYYYTTAAYTIIIGFIMAVCNTDFTGTVNSEKSNVDQAECHDKAFVCPYCRKCTIEQFFSEGCPKQPQPKEKKKLRFPYLNLSDLDDDDRTDLEERLKFETREIKLCFAKFILNIIRSLETLQIPLERLKMSIISLDAFTDDIGVKTLDLEDRREIEAASNISEIFITLQKYISFFNYHIVEHLIDQHGITRDHNFFEEYLRKFHNFCKRNIFEVPHDVFASKSRKTAKVFALKCSEAVSTMRGVQSMKGSIARVFGMRYSALQLCSIKKGCVELHFLISVAIAEHIFPLSSNHHSALGDIGVRVLFCDTVDRIFSGEVTDHE